MKKTFDTEILNRLSGLKEKSNYKNLILLSLDWLLIASSIFLCSLFPDLYIFAIIMIGSRMRALENMVHEASHILLSKNKFLNKWIGNLCCAFPLGESLYTYHLSHMQHHRWLGDHDKDPDLIRAKKLGIEKFSTKNKVILHILKIISLIQMPKYLVGTIKSFIYAKNTPKHELLIRFAFYCLIAGVITFTQSWKGFLLFWVVPYLTSFQIIRFLGEMSEHSGLFDSDKLILMTRNNLCHPILRFFIYPHNDAYHLVHHLFPGIPGYHLPKAHHILLEDAEYRAAHHCHGYFLSGNGTSTISNMVMQTAN